MEIIGVNSLKLEGFHSSSRGYKAKCVNSELIHVGSEASKICAVFYAKYIMLELYESNNNIKLIGFDIPG